MRYRTIFYPKEKIFRVKYKKLLTWMFVEDDETLNFVSYADVYGWDRKRKEFTSIEEADSFMKYFRGNTPISDLVSPKKDRPIIAREGRTQG